MTILEIMERSGMSDTHLAIGWIKDAVDLIQSNTKENLKVKKMNLVKSVDGDDNQYDLPADMIALDSVSLLDTEDDNKYKRIRRLATDLIVTEDTSP